MTEKKRIEWVDLMKGITIILVTLLHCQIHIIGTNDAMLTYLRMPTFIFLSGLFFSTRQSFKHFIANRTNRYVLTWVFFTLLHFFVCGMFRSDFCFKTIKGELIYKALICGSNNVNPPMWFLKCLFFTSLWAYLFNAATKRMKRSHSIALLIGLSVAAFYANKLLLPYFGINYVVTLLFNMIIIQSLVILPIFYLPYMLKDKIIAEHKFVPMTIAFAASLIVWTYMSGPCIKYHEGIFPERYIMFLPPAIGAVFCMYYVCYYIRRVPFISYLGRYSIVILGTNKCIKWIIDNQLHIPNQYAIAAIILATAPLLIWVLTRIAPHFTAQKDLLKVDEDGKVRISFKD